MKKILFLLAIFIVNLFFTGCAPVVYEAKVIESKNKNDGFIVSIRKEDSSKSKEAFKKVFKLASEKTLSTGKNKFIITNKDTNNLIGFPVNTYNDLYRYCFNKERKNIKVLCEEINTDIFIEFRILTVDNADYNNFVFDANEVLEDIKNEK